MTEHLYKILSKQNWLKSQEQGVVHLSEMDKEFIHLAMEDQLPRILDKFWKNEKEYVILKLDVSKLIGRLVLEANPGGETKYYHLYEGEIPLQAIVEKI